MALDLGRLKVADGVLVPDEDVGAGNMRAWALGAGDDRISFSVYVELAEGSFKHFGIGVVANSVAMSKLMQLDTVKDCAGTGLYRVLVGERALCVEAQKGPLTGMSEAEPRRVRLDYIAGPPPKLFFAMNDDAAIDLTRHAGAERGREPLVRPSRGVRCDLGREVSMSRDMVHQSTSFAELCVRIEGRENVVESAQVPRHVCQDAGRRARAVPSRGARGRVPCAGG